MLPTIIRKALEFSRILVVRVVLIALLAVLAIVLAKLSSALIPEGLSYSVGAGAVDRILTILANTMLTVTTFSLTVLAATHRAVAQLWTPRAHQMLMQDTLTQNVLATFVGAYLYALLGIVLRETEVFQGEELVVLFAMTVLVALLVVAAIIRWIGHLEVFGSLLETGRRIEKWTQDAWELRAKWPCLGAHELDDVPEEARTVRAAKSGYLQQVYQDRLQEAAERADARIWIVQPVGTYVHEGAVLARTDGEGDELDDAIRANLSLGVTRNYTQDPEFGLVCLSEIGSRALSSGVNDPGTAIEVVRRMVRILITPSEEHGGDDLRHDRLYLPRFDPGAALHRSFAPLIRDGKGLFEVQDAIDDALAAVSEHEDRRLAAAAREMRSRHAG